MSAKEELELDISMCVRCTIHTRNKSYQDLYSSEFQFKGGRWKLNYYNHPFFPGRYRLYLQKCSGVAPNPLHVSVQVESSRTDRIVTSLSEETRFTDEFEEDGYWKLIWSKCEDEILRFFPEFHREEVLKLLVVLKLEGTDSTETQTECSVPEATGQSGSNKSTSVQVQTTLPLNATPCLESLSEEFAQLLAEGSDHDIEFQCGAQSTKAHKLIVCKRSPVIASMLASDMVEARTRVVTIPDMEPDIFRQFLGYLYSGRLGELTFVTALRLYEAGDQYAVHSLTKRCREFLMEHLSTDNACEVLVAADFHSDKDLAGKVIDFMVEKKFPRTSDHWADFSDEYPRLANKVLDRAWDVFGN